MLLITLLLPLAARAEELSDLLRDALCAEEVERDPAKAAEQYQALLKTEGVTVDFTDDGIQALARIAADVNEAVENIGARRLQTVMEKLLEDISFEAEERAGETVTVDAKFVEEQLSGIARNADLSRYVL